MTAITSAKPPLGRRISTYLYQRPKLILLLLLAPPLIWLGVVYLGSLAALMIQSFFRLDSFTGQVVPELTLQNYGQLFSEAHLGIMARTTIMASVVTLFSIGLAFPLAYFMARYASPRAKSWLYLLVLIPLWSSYLVRVFAWKLILAKEGVFTWFVNLLGLGGTLDRVLAVPGIGGTSLSVSNLGMFIVFVYVWLPYMILPIQASLERVPKSLLEASADLGARPGHTFRTVILPLALPGIVAGSIFTFSLTLGDFVVPYVIGDSSPFVGLAVYAYQGTSGNIPLAAALTVFPMVVMIIYLAIARKFGAFEAL
jgi:putative spermidine/putrescine transport system permease protein